MALGGDPSLADGCCHLDPDLRSGRAAGWVPAFGQTGAAQTHLANQGLGLGDLFLFFGRFRHTEYAPDGRLRYVRSAPTLHIVFGYLQVGVIVQGDQVRDYPWHPHAEKPHPLPNNTLYLASDRLTFSDAAGSGVLGHREDRVLTAPGFSQSRWRLLDWMDRASISYHTKASIKDGYFQSAAKGQEFVMSGSPQAQGWAESVIAVAQTRPGALGVTPSGTDLGVRSMRDSPAAILASRTCRASTMIWLGPFGRTRPGFRWAECGVLRKLETKMSRASVVAWLVPVAVSVTFVTGLAGASPAYAARGFSGVDQPTVAGTFAVGSTLTAKRDTKTSPKATTVTYRWMRSGKSISKATNSKYRLATSDRGKQVSIRVCYKKKKYTTSCVTSAQVTIAAKMTTLQSQAVRMAKSYLSTQAFSRSGLIKQLEYEGFSEPDSVFAVDHVGASWTVQAVRMAGSYLKFQAFSRSGLIRQLEYEGFTTADSSNAADHVGANWAAQAVRMAREYLKFQAFSRSGLISQLEYEGFSAEDAAAAADAVGL